MNNNTSSGSNIHYKPPFKFGLGGVPLGNEFAVVTDKVAYAILEAAWSAGIPPSLSHAARSPIFGPKAKT